MSYYFAIQFSEKKKNGVISKIARGLSKLLNCRHVYKVCYHDGKVAHGHSIVAANTNDEAIRKVKKVENKRLKKA